MCDDFQLTDDVLKVLVLLAELNEFFFCRSYCYHSMKTQEFAHVLLPFLPFWNVSELLLAYDVVFIYDLNVHVFQSFIINSL